MHTSPRLPQTSKVLLANNSTPYFHQDAIPAMSLCKIFTLKLLCTTHFSKETLPFSIFLGYPPHFTLCIHSCSIKVPTQGDLNIISINFCLPPRLFRKVPTVIQVYAGFAPGACTVRPTPWIAHKWFICFLRSAPCTFIQQESTSLGHITDCFCLHWIFCLITALFREKGLFREVIHCAVDFPAYSIPWLFCPLPVLLLSWFTHSSEQMDSLLRFIFGFQLSLSSQLCVPPLPLMPSLSSRFSSWCFSWPHPSILLPYLLCAMLTIFRSPPAHI